MAKTLEMTEEQYAAALTAASTGGAQAVLAALGIKQAPETAPMTPNEMFAAQVKAQRQSLEAPIKVDVHPGCVSHMTGAKFTIHASRGVVFALPEYAYPEGIETHTPEGGLVPDRMAIKDVHGQYTAEYKQWRWESFWQVDLKAYVGKAVPTGFETLKIAA